jgi:hypothetical protein
MEDRQNRAVAGRVEELVRVPARGQRPGLGLAVPDDGGDHQLGVVEGGAVGVRQRVTQLAALVDRPRGLRGDVARYPAGEGELGEQSPHPGLVLRYVGVDLAVGALQPGRGDRAGPAVPGPHHVHHRQVTSPDRPVQVGVDEVQSGRGPPVPQQPRLHVFRAQRLAQQRVPHQVDLADRQVVRRPPPGVHRLQLSLVERAVPDRGVLQQQVHDFRVSVLDGRRPEMAPYRSELVRIRREPSVLRAGSPADDRHRARRVPDALIADRAEQQPREAALPPSTHERDPPLQRPAAAPAPPALGTRDR